MRVVLEISHPIKPEPLRLHFTIPQLFFKNGIPAAQLKLYMARYMKWLDAPAHTIESSSGYRTTIRFRLIGTGLEDDTEISSGKSQQRILSYLQGMLADKRAFQLFLQAMLYTLLYTMRRQGLQLPDSRYSGLLNEFFQRVYEQTHNGMSPQQIDHLRYQMKQAGYDIVIENAYVLVSWCELQSRYLEERNSSGYRNEYISISHLLHVCVDAVRKLTPWRGRGTTNLRQCAQRIATDRWRNPPVVDREILKAELAENSGEAVAVQHAKQLLDLVTDGQMRVHLNGWRLRERRLLSHSRPVPFTFDVDSNTVTFRRRLSDAASSGMPFGMLDLRHQYVAICLSEQLIVTAQLYADNSNTYELPEKESVWEAVHVITPESIATMRKFYMDDSTRIFGSIYTAEKVRTIRQGRRNIAEIISLPIPKMHYNRTIISALRSPNSPSDPVRNGQYHTGADWYVLPSIILDAYPAFDEEREVYYTHAARTIKLLLEGNPSGSMLRTPEGITATVADGEHLLQILLSSKLHPSLRYLANQALRRAMLRCETVSDLLVLCCSAHTLTKCNRISELHLRNLFPYLRQQHIDLDQERLWHVIRLVHSLYRNIDPEGWREDVLPLFLNPIYVAGRRIPIADDVVPIP